MSKRKKPSGIISLLIVAAVTIFSVGCKEKSKTEQVIEKSKSAAEEAGDAIKDAAHKTGEAVERGAEKAWEGVKKGAHEVSRVATNVTGEVKAGVEKIEEKLKQSPK